MTEASGRAVLVVDDNPALRRLVRAFLTGRGFAVLEAQDGAEALRLVEALSPPGGHVCAILLEMMLPDGDGIRVLCHLATLQVDAPVVAVSASRPLLAEAMLAGATLAVALPSSISELISKGTAATPTQIVELLCIVARQCPRAHDQPAGASIH